MVGRFSIPLAICVGFIAGAGALGAGGLLVSEHDGRDVVASGAVVVDATPKPVRTPGGGTITEVRVRDGDQVAAGDVIMRLDDAMARSNLETLSRTLDQLAVRRARLVAEQTGAPSLRLPQDIAARADDPQIAALIANETELFKMRAALRASETVQLRERISQLNKEISGYTVQAGARDSEIALISEQLEAARGLRTKSLMPLATLTALEREAVRLQGERQGQLVATIAQAQGRIAETEFLLAQLDRDRVVDVSRELRETETSTTDLSERRLSLEDRLRRLEIRAAQAGVVYLPPTRTIGDDVAAGDEVGLIAPRVESFAVEAVISARDVGRLRLGQNAEIQLASGREDGAKFSGTLARIVPESAERQSAAPFYRARIAVAAPDCLRLGQLRPGTQAEVRLAGDGGPRLSSIWQPLRASFARALRVI